MAKLRVDCAGFMRRQQAIITKKVPINTQKNTTGLPCRSPDSAFKCLCAACKFPDLVSHETWARYAICSKGNLNNRVMVNSPQTCVL